MPESRLKRLRRSSLVAAALLLACPALPVFAQGSPSYDLMPLPRHIAPGTGALQVGDAFTVAVSGPGASPRMDAAKARLLMRLDTLCGGVRRANHGVVAGAAPVLGVEVGALSAPVQQLGEDESYTLHIDAQHASLRAPNELGALHGMETLVQLVRVADGGCSLPAVEIDDAPRFAWRGLHLDVSRHFEPIDVIKRQLDGMAAVKLNVFHWHLSDDQGFRAESKKYPRFTSVASNGQFYTQDQMRDVVAYARERGIRVIPEFDMPGHTTSWLLAYPEIGAGEHITELPLVFGIPQAELDPSNEATYKVIDNLVGEMGAIFPDAYFHIGGDETAGTGWLQNPRIHAYMDKHGYAKPADLQAYFNQRLLAILTKHGKKMIGWDEILNPSLPKSILVQSWRGEASLAAGAEQGYEGILSAPYYLDGQKTAGEMFLADPLPADTKLDPEQQKRILGGEVCMWAEQLNQDTVDSRIWPRTAAIAERFWSPQEDRDLRNMYPRLWHTSLELDALGLQHISGPQRMRRGLGGNSHPEALEVFASVLEPVSFGERYEGQKTDGYTSLNRLVDAVVADPPSREEIIAEVNAVTHAPDSPAGRLAAVHLAETFEAWRKAVPALLAQAQRTPRLNDTADRARQLGELADSGLQALTFLRFGSTPPPAWLAAQQAVLDEAAKPSALVRFTFLPSMRQLVEFVASQGKGPAASAAAQ